MATTDETCCYEGCEREATTTDGDGDAACEYHAAQSRRYVVATHLDQVGSWLATEHVARVEAAVAEQGWDVTIREPRKGEAEATYYVKADGTLQILGFSIPRPEGLEDALREASDRVIRGAA